MKIHTFRICLLGLALGAGLFASLHAQTPTAQPPPQGNSAALPRYWPEDPPIPRYRFCQNCGHPMPLPIPQPREPRDRFGAGGGLERVSGLTDDIFLEVFALVSRANITTEEAIARANIIAEGYRAWYQRVALPFMQRTRTEGAADKADYKDCYMMVAKIGLDRGDAPDKVRKDADLVCSHMITRMNGGNGNP
jgi:hypothetical protein